MAILSRLRLALVAVALLVTSGCFFVDPILTSEDYEVEAPGGSKVKVRIHGGGQVSRLRQTDLVQDYMLDLSRDPDRASLAFDAMLDLERLFEDYGYPLVHVRHDYERTARGAKVEFFVESGPRVSVSKLRIHGNQAIDDEALRQYWERRRTEAFGLGDDVYVAESLQAMTEGMEAAYRRQGFLDARITLDPVDPPISATTEEVEIHVRVVEGPRYANGEITLAPELADVVGAGAPQPPRTGAPHIAQAVQEYALAVANHLRRRGHLKPEVQLTVQPDRDKHTVSARILGRPGSVVRVRKVLIEGNDFVSATYIRKRITLSDDTTFDGGLEEESLLLLYRTGMFRKIEIEYRPAGDAVVDVAFVVTETTRYMIQPLIGWGSYEELRGGLEFEMLKILGTSFDFNTRGTVSDKGHRVVATIADTQFLPEVLGFNTTFSIAADTYRRIEPSYIDSATGISPSLFHIFNRYISARLAYTYRERNDADSDVIDPGAQIGNYVEGSATFEVSYDSRDNPLMPTRGQRFSLRYKTYQKGLGGDVEFDRVQLFGSAVLPLSRSFRLVARGEVGLLFPPDGFDSVPIQEKFFNVGDSTVRSFQEDDLAPPELLDVNGRVVGGAFRTIGNLELRYAPRYQPLRAIQTELSVFADAGNLGRNADEWGLQDMYYGIGGGVRFLLPIGPVRFDGGWNPDPLPGLDQWEFHFSIGYPF